MRFVPSFLEIREAHFSLLSSRCLIDGPEILNHLLALFSRDIFQGIAHLMDDIELNLNPGEYGLNCLRKSFQAVNAGNKDILDATVSQFGHNL